MSFSVPNVVPPEDLYTDDRRIFASYISCLTIPYGRADSERLERLINGGDVAGKDHPESPVSDAASPSIPAVPPASARHKMDQSGGQPKDMRGPSRRPFGSYPEEIAARPEQEPMIGRRPAVALPPTYSMFLQGGTIIAYPRR